MHLYTRYNNISDHNAHNVASIYSGGVMVTYDDTFTISRTTFNNNFVS